MAVTKAEFEQATARALEECEAGHVQSARYNPRRGRVIVQLSTGVEVTFPVKLAEGLASASPEDLAEIEISPTGLGLHWPRLDADLYVPALLQGVFGSRSWMASTYGSGRGEKPLIGQDRSVQGKRPQGRTSTPYG